MILLKFDNQKYWITTQPSTKQNWIIHTANENLPNLSQSSLSALSHVSNVELLVLGCVFSLY